MGEWVMDSGDLMGDMMGSAYISECGTYRYGLSRHFPVGSGRLNIIMLNPSTADEFKNDPTITRCIERTKALGFIELVVTNLFALRSTDPRALLTHNDPVGPENDRHIRAVAAMSDRVVVGWGNWGRRFHRHEAVLGILREFGEPYCLGVSKIGQPIHPLYVPYRQELIPYLP